MAIFWILLGVIFFFVVLYDIVRTAAKEGVLQALSESHSLNNKDENK